MTLQKKTLTLPAGSAEIRQLRAGDEVLLSGRIVTGRDRAHRWLVEAQPEALRPFLKDGAIYHCGPVMTYRNGEWQCRAAGPTTSLREEPYLADIVQEYQLRCIIGKGGLGERSAEALRNSPAVYLSAVGGAAVCYANTVTAVENVFELEAFGMPEAMWVLRVRDFPLIVSMDAYGNSLHRDVETRSRESLASVLEAMERSF